VTPASSEPTPLQAESTGDLLARGTTTQTSDSLHPLGSHSTSLNNPNLGCIDGSREFLEPNGQTGVQDQCRGPHPWWVRYQDFLALVLAIGFVCLTRIPVARSGPIDSDEFGFLQFTRESWLPVQHSLFLAAARAIGAWAGNPYRGFLILDMATSALALTAVWWWLRALVRPATAAAATLLLGCAPSFWAYGAMASNYTAIPLVGALLLGIAVRTWDQPRTWHPYAAAVILALGAGYRQDIGLFWLPIYFVILWRHPWSTIVSSLILFTALNLAWIVPMINGVGLERYRIQNREYSYNAVQKNSIWHLGFRDTTFRYGLKLSMGLLWTFGPGLLFVPLGMVHLARSPRGRTLGGLLLLSVLPALGYHLLIHFGVPGYALHYTPALLALMALGAGDCSALGQSWVSNVAQTPRKPRAPMRLAVTAGVLALVFCLYPTNYDRPGVWGDIELAFCRMTRVGLNTPLPDRDVNTWRTLNSVPHPAWLRAKTLHQND